MPTAQLDGFDISTSQFPHANWLPRNVTLHQLDALARLPDDLRGRYDVVHIGLAALAVPDGDPSALLDNALAMCKPGGYIQWNEADVARLPRVAAAPDVPRDSFDAFYDGISAAVASSGRRVDFGWIRHLPRIVASHAAVDAVVAAELLEVPDDLAQPATQVHLLSFGEMLASGQLDAATVRALGLRRLYYEAMDDVQCGMSVRMGQVVVVARKKRRLSVGGRPRTRGGCEVM